MDSWCQFLEGLEVRSGVREPFKRARLYEKNIALHEYPSWGHACHSLCLAEKNTLLWAM